MRVATIIILSIALVSSVLAKEPAVSLLLVIALVAQVGLWVRERKQ